MQATGKSPIPEEVIADNIMAISRGVKKMREGRLNDRAIIALLHDSTRMSKADIERVIDGMENLEKLYLKKPPVSNTRTN